MSAVVAVSQGAVNTTDASLLADLGGSVSGSKANSQMTQVGVGWPSPYLPVPFWMLVTDGAGWAWSMTDASAKSMGLRLADKPSASLLSTYL
ncbi:MAG: hypothetical protein ACYDGY_00520 [Acidimicrobiales bacterium]